ncbi:unnamed protein product [Arctia plantaginis]|uniref:Peptidase C1A papain C-terminal domain-containing protein n=1 Tax=Arctia plantaginis TaxID=874455 RepID=A0A8S0ZV57_ARCPL|nr:unnamed protein product [Arctia plantaginis]
MYRVLVILFILKQCHGFLILRNGSDTLITFNEPVNDKPLPIYFDWRSKNAVSPVKDQKNCNACWAFSVIANIESQLKIYKNDEKLMSEQFLIDCDHDQEGCKTGSITSSFANIVTRFGGVLLEKDYPYQNGQQKCTAPNPPPYLVKVTGFKRVSSDEEEMAKAVFHFGPLSAAINAASMRHYKSNIIDEPSDKDCNPNDLDHAVLIVGYNVYVNTHGRETPYWIIKNSWGEDWGDKGYYYLVRGRNACGIASDVSFSVVT